jgi:uncharacterized protein YecE (DUF72 family)
VIRVGPAGWSYADWEGIVYPRSKPRGFHALSHLARYVNCIEVNSSFYSVPRADYAERWVREVEPWPDFRFTVKLQDVFTHRPLPSGDGAALDALAHAWLEGIEPLRASGKLSAVLVQFPVGFRHAPDGEERLRRIEGVFGHLPLVVELRHRSWFEPAPLGLVERLGYSLARIDLPPARDHPPATPPRIGRLSYLRVHGRNAATWFDREAGRDQRYDYLYTKAEVVELSNIARAIDETVDETFVVTNNHFAGQAVTNAIELIAALRLKPEPLAPAELVAKYPRLRDVARPDGQDILF